MKKTLITLLAIVVLICSCKKKSQPQVQKQNVTTQDTTHHTSIDTVSRTMMVQVMRGSMNIYVNSTKGIYISYSGINAASETLTFKAHKDDTLYINTSPSSGGNSAFWMYLYENGNIISQNNSLGSITAVVQ